MDILLIAYIIRTVHTILYHLSWWHIKEYRIDRMRVHLTETSQGRGWVVNPFYIFKWVLFLVYILIPKTLVVITVWFYVMLVLYGYEAVKALIEVPHGWRRPPLRPRAVGIYISALVTILYLVFSPATPFFFTLLCADILLGPFIALLVYVSNRMFSLHKRRIIQKARYKIAQYPDLKVIGVTGSYGKTTTKELITQILKTKYRVVSTILSQNADIGIAERILKTDLNGVDYFVCEMAAYHRGEILSSCLLFKDKIVAAVITGINEQHQSLFGSMDTTRKAKYELVEALNSDGFVVFNANSPKSKPMIDRAHREKRTVYVVSPDTLYSHALKLPAPHFKENTAMAVAVAGRLGLSKRDIKSALSALVFPKKTLEISHVGDVVYIDSTFNSNPDAVYAALDHLKTYEGIKILVLQPLIELGNYASEAHEKIGAQAASICDYILLTNDNFNTPFMRGTQKSLGKTRHASFVTHLPVIKKGAILFQGKEAAHFIPSHYR